MPKFLTDLEIDQGCSLILTGIENAVTDPDMFVVANPTTKKVGYRTGTQLLSDLDLVAGGKLLPTGTEGQMLTNVAGIWTAQSYLNYNSTNRELILQGYNGVSALSSTMHGLNLIATELGLTSKYTPGVKFMSSDSQLITENPKLLAGIFGRSTETYNSDNKGGMAMDFFVTGNSPGSINIPALLLTLESGALTMYGNIALGTNNLILTGSIGNAESVSTKGWFMDLDVFGTGYFSGQLLASNTFSAGYFSYYSASASINDVTYYTILHTDGNALSSNYQYRVSANIQGTNADTGSRYLVWYDANTSTWQSTLVSSMGSSVDAIVFVDTDGIPKIKLGSATVRTARIRVEAQLTNDSDTRPHIWGSDYMWQRTGANLSYSGGTVSVDGQIISTLATGISPFAVTSATMVTNLNVEYLNGHGASYFADASHTHSGVYEPVLGNPATSGFLLSSTTAGVRSWVAPYSYTHPAKAWTDKTGLTGAYVISNLTIDSLGHPTDWTTRQLTYSDVGAAPSGHNHDSAYSAIGHNHAGVYEPVITKSTGFLKYSGSVWTWDANTYALSSHAHTGVYDYYNHWLLAHHFPNGTGGTDWIDSGESFGITASYPLSMVYSGSGTSVDPYTIALGLANSSANAVTRISAYGGATWTSDTEIPTSKAVNSLVSGFAPLNSIAYHTEAISLVNATPGNSMLYLVPHASQTGNIIHVRNKGNTADLFTMDPDGLLTAKNQLFLNYSITADGVIVGSGRSTDALICGNLASGTNNLISLDYGGANKFLIDYAGKAYFKESIYIYNGYVYFDSAPGNNYIGRGSSGDTEIYGSGGIAMFYNTGSGHGLSLLVGSINGEVSLYYQGLGGKKLTTTANGIDITGYNNASSGYKTNGVSGLSETLTFYTTSGKVATITVSGGIITSRTIT